MNFVGQIVRRGHFLRRPKRLPGTKKAAEEEHSREFLLEGGVPTDGTKGSRREREGVMPPKGSLAVYVGAEMRRYVIPAAYLCSPPFVELMEMAAEEFGFDHAGGIRIPCEEESFEELVRILEEKRSKKRKKKKKKIDGGKNNKN